MKLFSAFGAADLLEKDRQTVRRALRHVAPDGFEGKNPRWRLPTIIAALARNNSQPETDATLRALFDQFDTGCAALASIPDVEARRREARRLMGLLVELDKIMRADARSRGEDDLRAQLRCDQHFRLGMRNFERPCEWTLEQCWAALAAIVDDDDAPSKPRAKVKRAG